MSVEAIQNWLIVLNLFLTSGLAYFFHYRATRNSRKKFLADKLFKLQEFSMKYPFLENPTYCKIWDNLKEKFNNNSLTDEEIENFLQYDVYTEMLFNYIEESYNFHKCEKKMLADVDLKSWVRNHAACWKNPLIEHSNHDTYRKEVRELIDNWIK